MNRLTRDSDLDEPWIVFTDVVLAALFLFVLFIFALYIRYEKLTLLEELESRQAEIAKLIRDSVPAEYSVAIDSGEAFSQRVTFSSDLLFPTCRDRLTGSGSEVVTLVGRLLGLRYTYFESIEVEGHTDPRPPTGSEQCPFRDNWELSSRRAATVVRILAGQAGLSPTRLSAVGRAQFRPPDAVGISMLSDVDQPGSDPWRELRRIEMVLQYSEDDIEAELRQDSGEDRVEGTELND